MLDARHPPHHCLQNRLIFLFVSILVSLTHLHLFYENSHVGCRCKNGWTGQYCEFEKMNLNVATKAFLGFGTMIVVIVVLFGGILFVRSRNDRDIEYEAANVEAPTLNPYGEPDSDLSDSSEDEYEFTDIAII